jgi:hypothetical protein
MRFWIREVAGWALLVLGLFMFYLSYHMLIGYPDPVTGLPRRMVLEAGQWSVVGIIVFRGGIHLLKVAVAARVCMQAVDEISGDKVGPARPTRPPMRTLPRTERRM